MWGDDTVFVYPTWQGRQPGEVAASHNYSAIVHSGDPPYFHIYGGNNNHYYFICEMVPGKYTTLKETVNRVIIAQ